MKKLSFLPGLVFCFLSLKFTTFAQTAYTTSQHTIAVFVPLYLDSAFDAAGEYVYGKNFPKFLNPGLEFYEGVQLAVDSLNKTGASLKVLIYDTRSSGQSIAKVMQRPEMSKVELIIGFVSNNEIRVLAENARMKSIPFINANIPNDAGVTNNPYYVVLNSTLRTHLQAMYKFLQKSYATSPIVVFRLKGAQEDMLKNYFTEIERSTSSVSLKLKFITLNKDFTASQLKPYLDSNRVTMCIAGSLDVQFAKLLTRHLAALNENYPSQVMGMPNWDGIKELEKKENKGLEIFYSTPFYHAKTDKVSIGITNYFKNNLYSRPTDMVFRGYECFMHFSKLLLDHGTNLGSAIGEKKYKVFTDLDIQPVFLNKQSPTLDYFENRKIYFVKMLGGVIKGVYW
ncbi:MAG: amino acid ABC transporter substrate-binding protein [Chitinophagaceae bacterium]